LSVGGDHLDLACTSFNEFSGAGPPENSIRKDFVFERGEKRRDLIETAQHAKEVARMQLLNAVRALALDRTDSPRIAGIAGDGRRGACGDDRCGSPSPHFWQEGQ